MPTPYAQPHEGGALGRPWGVICWARQGAPMMGWWVDLNQKGAPTHKK